MLHGEKGGMKKKKKSVTVLQGVKMKKNATVFASASGATSTRKGGKG